MRKLHVALTMAIFTIGFGSIALSEEATPPQEDRYAPKQWGLPEMISGYPVLAVLTADNTGCMLPGERRLVLQAPQPTIDEALRDFPAARMTSELQGWEWRLVGPGLSREHVVNLLEHTYRERQMSGCAMLALPNPAEAVELVGELKSPGKTPGFTVITNGDAGPDKNAQSVVLIAPNNVLNNQGPPEITCTPQCTKSAPVSALLNNVVTNHDCVNPQTGPEPCFLQVGLAFWKDWPWTETAGRVVWADTFRGLLPREFDPSIPYIAGHHYWTTITFTNGFWWMCAVDIQDSSTYRCTQSAVGGTYLRWFYATSVFAENGNRNSDWYTGNPANFPDLFWKAYRAEVYVDGKPKPWSYQKVSTFSGCQNDWPAEIAVDGNLSHNGSVTITTSQIPLQCDGATTEPTNHKPVIMKVNFPSAIYGDGMLVDGTVQFRDDNGGVIWAQFDVVPGTCSGCTPFSFDPQLKKVIEGWFAFGMWCTTQTGFSWTMQVTLKDEQGNMSNPPYKFSVECKPPSIARSLNTAFETEEQAGGGF